MDHEEAKALKESWGEKACDHPSFEDKYLFGSKTGDFFCAQCGKSFTQRQKAQLNRQASSPRSDQFLTKGSQIKERLDRIANQKSKLAAMEKANPANELMNKALSEQDSMIAVLDKVLLEMDFI